MTDPAARKILLDRFLAQHLAHGWSLVARVSDDLAVIAWQNMRRTLTVDATGETHYTDSPAQPPVQADPYPARQIGMVLGALCTVVALVWLLLL